MVENYNWVRWRPESSYGTANASIITPDGIGNSVRPVSISREEFAEYEHDPWTGEKLEKKCPINWKKRLNRHLENKK